MGAYRMGKEMARTPLVDLLRRAAAISALSRATGESLDEVQARALEARRGLSRRRFLQQSAGASAALLLTACARVPLQRRADEDVVIVGAGIAGLTCAWR